MRRRVRAAVPAIVTVALVAGALAAPPRARGQMTTATPYRIVLPRDPGPHPALLFVSGCSGFAPAPAPDHYPRMAQAFADRGFAVVFVDYLGARGRKTCGGMVRPNDVAPDILAAAAYARTQPFVRASDINVIGWSMGAGGALAAINALPADRPAPFRRVIAYYPECYGVGSPWPVKVPVLMLLAGRDDVSPMRVCQELVARAGNGQPIEVHVYPEAHHAFDVAELPPVLPRGAAGAIGHHPESAAAARAEVLRFLTP